MKIAKRILVTVIGFLLGLAIGIFILPLLVAQMAWQSETWPWENLG